MLKCVPDSNVLCCISIPSPRFLNPDHNELSLIHFPRLFFFSRSSTRSGRTRIGKRRELNFILVLLQLVRLRVCASQLTALESIRPVLVPLLECALPRNCSRRQQTLATGFRCPTVACTLRKQWAERVCERLFEFSVQNGVFHIQYHPRWYPGGRPAEPKTSANFPIRKRIDFLVQSLSRRSPRSTSKFSISSPGAERKEFMQAKASTTSSCAVRCCSNCA